jgi:hypothetical protein
MSLKTDLYNGIADIDVAFLVEAVSESPDCNAELLARAKKGSGSMAAHQVNGFPNRLMGCFEG